ncbi:MAG: hypothetical protein ACK4NC_06040 [Candidatus Gracilibacteria bacterium]
MYKKIFAGGALLLCVSCGAGTPSETVSTDSASGSMMEMASMRKEQITDVKMVIEQQSAYVISLLQKNDFSALASQVHPEKGLLLSADIHLDDKTFPRQIIARKELAGFLKNTTPRIWGSNGYTELPLRMTGKEFWETWVYTRTITLNSPRAFDEVRITDVNKVAAAEMMQKRFPNSHFVEYSVLSSSTGEVKEKDWSLRLVFSEYNGQWYLVGIVRDQFIA